MTAALRHVVVALACGAATALLCVLAGTVALLAVHFGVVEASLANGVAASACYAIAPVAGLAAFVAGLLASLLRAARVRADAAEPDRR
jgi:hypothetical protein